ncbi:hypothetical protein AB1Y20_008286 [Prymnesium parvum]|uniref:Uncharacterized protein n=1 Tax=Prymnesium parvum TaxID=97485 RepID=A0AB34IV12_PRYPA
MLHRERARTRAQESRIDELQTQLNQMKTILSRMQQPPSPPSSNGDASDYDAQSSHASRSRSPPHPVKPSRRRNSPPSSSRSSPKSIRPPSAAPAPLQSAPASVPNPPVLRPPSATPGL